MRHCVCLSFRHQPYLRNQWSYSYQIWHQSDHENAPCINFSSLHLELWLHNHVLQYTCKCMLSKRETSNWYTLFKNDVKQYVPIPLLVLPTRDIGETDSISINVGETGSIAIKAICIVLSVKICNSITASNTWLIFNSYYNSGFFNT